MVNDICGSLGPVLRIVNIIINIIWIGIPIVLIILGSIDLGKAVISSEEKAVKEAKKSFINRFLYAVAVFAVVWLVTFIFDQVANLGLDDAKPKSWQECWKVIRDIEPAS